MNVIQAASDHPSSGIMRPREDGVIYDPRLYDPSSQHVARDWSADLNHNGDRERDSLDSNRHDPARHPYSSHPDHPHAHTHTHTHTHMPSASVHGHHPGTTAASTAGAPTAPGSSNHSPRNPASHPCDRATPPQPQGYRPFLSSPMGEANGPGPSSNMGRRGSDASAATISTKRAHDTPGPDLRTPGSDRQRNSQHPTPTSATADRTRQPWEEGYRKNQTQEAAAANPSGSRSSQGTAQPPTLTAIDEPGPDPEPPTKKRRRGKAAPTQDIPDGAEVEYEDPGGDRSRGPVFVHPPKGAAQACIRCHRIKRKCDGAWPRCASCARVDVACVFELSAATSSYVHKLKKTNEDLAADLRASEARIHALEMQLTLENQSGANQDHTGAGSVSDFGRLALSAGSIREHAPLSFAILGGGSAVSPGAASPPPQTGNTGRHDALSREGSHLHLSDILSRDNALKCAQTYFDSNGLAYPFLERTEMIPEMLDVFDTEKERERLDERLSPEMEHADRRKFIVYMMLTIGRSNAVRLGEVSDHCVDKALYSAALRYRAKAVGREDMLCVQALLLMTMYSTEMPETGSLWQTLGMAGRVVMAIGLHRRSDAPAEIAEPRRRVFYSFYNLDRFVASTFSKPLTIAEQDIDIELPTDRPSDQPYRNWPIMHICRYLVRYRRLLGCTLTALYSVNGEQNALPEPGRRAIVRRLHEELEAWAADGPKPKCVIPFNRTVNHDKWLAIHYHQMLCMLYRPSPLYPDTTPATLRALHDASAKCIDLYCELWAVNKVGFNVIQLVGLFVACISLLCCLCECDTRMHSAEIAGPATTAATLAELGLPYTGVDDPAWATEIRARVAQCRNLFQTLGVGTPLSAKYRDIFTRVSELLLARYGPLTHDTDDHDHDHVMADATAAANGPDPSIGVIDTPVAATPAADSDMAGAWGAMNKLWYDLGDLFGDEHATPGLGSTLVPPNANAPVLPVGTAGGVSVGGPVGGVGGMGGVGVGVGVGGIGMPGMSGIGLPVSNIGLPGASASLGVGMGGAAYPPLGYAPANANAHYGQYGAYAASYPGPYGEYGVGFDDSWSEHWRPEGEGWWGHV